MVSRVWVLASLGVSLLGCRAPVAHGGEDGSETSEDGDATSGDETGGEPNAELDAFFDSEVVQEFRLEIADADRQAMFDALPELVYVPATFHWNDITVSEVGVRFKGNSSSGPDQTHKRSYLIKFNEYVSGQRFLDLRRLSLDNGVQFGSLFSERLVTDALRQRGAVASRTNYARLVVNDDYQGVYVNVERVDRSFLEHHFDDPGGPLYKVHTGGPGAGLEYIGEDPSAFAETFENKGADAWDGDMQPLVDLTRELDQLAPDDFRPWFEENFDAHGFGQALPVLLFGGAFDQYTGWNAHNYYLYREPGSERWTYIPWDLDVGLADDAFGHIPVISGWNAAYPYPKATRALLARYLDDDELKGAYRETAATVLEEHFHPDVLVPKLVALHDQIESDLAEDPFPPVRITNPSDTDYPSILASQVAFIEARYESATAELAEPQDTPPPDPEEVPPPGDPSPQDPSDLMLTSVTSTEVELAWTDNAPNEAVVIVQRCTGAACVDFGPHIGLDPDSTTATDENISPGQTYRYRVYAIIPMGGPVPTGPSNVVEAVIP